jgi:hypothetical protein
MYFNLGVKRSKQDFFNFESELGTFVRELKSVETRMIVIKGIRRAGKSSLLRVGLAESKMPYLLLDARALGPFSPDQIYDLLAGSLSELMEKHRTLKKFLERVKGLSISGVEIEFVSRGRPTLVEVLKKMGAWGESEDKQVVLALDEAQEFRLFPKFDGLLAHVYDYSTGLKLVLSGSEVGVLDEFLGKEKAKAPLFGRPCFEIKMERLSKEKAGEFLIAGFEESKKKAKADEISEAIDVFDGSMGWLTSYGYHASRVGHKKAIEKTIQEGAKLVEDELESFLAIRRQARTRYLSILKLLSSPLTWSEVKRGLMAKLGRTISDKQLSHYLHELVDYGFAINECNKYALADPLVARACLRMR